MSPHWTRFLRLSHGWPYNHSTQFYTKHNSNSLPCKQVEAYSWYKTCWIRAVLFSSTIYTTFFRECRPIEPDFCGRIMAGFILHHCLTQILDLAFSFLIQVSNLQIRQKSYLTEILFFLIEPHVSFVCRQLNLPITESDAGVLFPPTPSTPRLFLFPGPGAFNVGLYCNVYSQCPLWIYTCSRIVFLTPFNVDPFPGRPLNFNTGINSPWSVDPLPMKRALWAEYLSSKAP